MKGGKPFFIMHLILKSLWYTRVKKEEWSINERERSETNIATWLKRENINNKKIRSCDKMRGWALGTESDESLIGR